MNCVTPDFPKLGALINSIFLKAIENKTKFEFNVYCIFSNLGTTC